MKLLHFFLLLSLVSFALSWEEPQVVPCIDQHCEECEDTRTNCTKCQDGYYMDYRDSICADCKTVSQNLTNCTLCTLNYKDEVSCYACEDDLFPDVDGANCLQCELVINNCTMCLNKTEDRDQLKCGACEQGFHLSDDQYSCVEDSPDASTAEIVAIAAGGIAVVGLGYYIVMKCKSPKKGKLLETQQFQ